MKEQNGTLAGGTGRWTIAEKIVTVFVLAYGLHYFGYFIRTRYFDWLDGAGLSDGISHCMGYLGHVIFLIVMLLYALAVRRDRRYILAFTKGKPSRNLKFGILGGLTGFVMMGICVLCASLNGNVEIHSGSGANTGIFVFAAICVFIQASVEEIESRAFAFGKMHGEGVPVIAAVIASSVYFSYLHVTKPGFNLICFISIFVVGILYALCYYYFKTIWFTCAAHMAWNYTQDFIFGLPDSGTPAAVSIMSSTVQGSGFFYDRTFGIEGSWMAIIVNIAACVVVALIGRRIHLSPKPEDG